MSAFKDYSQKIDATLFPFIEKGFCRDIIIINCKKGFFQKD